MPRSISLPLRLPTLPVVLLLPMLLLPMWCHADDAGIKRGAEVLAEQCAECHSVKEGRNKKGPSLFATLGRKAASLEGVEYSDALRDSGWVWNEERLRFYLSQPAKKANPGGKMKYDGLANGKDLNDLLAYLATLK